MGHHLDKWFDSHPDLVDKWRETMASRSDDEIVAYAVAYNYLEPVVDPDGQLHLQVVQDDNNPFWASHLDELDAILASLHDKGLISPAGVDEAGDITYELNLTPDSTLGENLEESPDT